MNCSHQVASSPRPPEHSSAVTAWLRLGSTAWVFVLALAAGARAGALTSADCMECHGDLEALDGRRELLVVPDTLAASVHAGMECTDCHHVPELPHDEKLPPPACADCHDAATADYAASIHGVARTSGIAEAPTCASCHGSHDVQLVSDPKSRVAPRNQPATCGVCHSDPRLVRKFYISVANPSAAYERGAHYRALMGGETQNHGELAGVRPPTCGTCHGGHRVLQASSVQSPVNPANVPSLCGGCHRGIAGIYRGSVHGRALAAGNRNAPNCTSCHGEHDIASSERGPSTETLAWVTSQACARCHADQRLVRRTGLPALRVASYEQSYHGLAGQNGSIRVARCPSCHGAHNIYREEDPRSLVNRKNLVLTCGHCHEGITARFASIRMHALVATETTTPAGMFRVAYLFLIFGVIGGMVVHNGVIFSRYLREKYRVEKRLRRLRRFGRFQVAQHLTLLVSFAVLAMTGFALKFPTSWWVDLLQGIGLGETTRRLIHRGAAVVLIVQSAIEVAWYMATRDGRRDIRSLLPTYRDVVDLVRNIRYHLFMADQPPRYDRFDYTEKAEYLALMWGTAVMALTGLMLWFPETFTRFLPSWAIEVATVVHFYEAVLATLSIFVWHFFFTIYHPREYPMRMTWLTGTMTEHAYRHHHPREYERLRNDPDAVIPPEHPEDGATRRQEQPPGHQRAGMSSGSGAATKEQGPEARG